MMFLMQFPQLESFVTVARTRHFTQAADRLGVTQPTLSKQIRALENSLGTALFVRERSGVTLTSAGEALLPHAERIVIDVETAQRAVHEVTGLRRGRVRLGATPSLCDGILPDVLTRFHATYPDLELEVREAGSPLLTRDLVRGRLDLALVIAPLRPDAGELETTPVMRERLVLAAPPGSTLPDAVDVADLRDLPLVMFREGYDLREVTMRACRRAGFTPRLAVEGGEMSAVLRFVEAGLGHAVVPEMVMVSRPALRSVQLRRPALDREIALAHRPGSLQLAALAFRDALLEQLAT